MNEYILPTPVAYDELSDRSVSTIKLNSAGPGYETCVFWLNGNDKVVASYASLEEAMEGHNKFLSCDWQLN